MTAQETVDEKEGALVIFIDDLDRCPRPKILKVLETIKLFMDKKGCIFVIGAASDIIEKGLKETYGEDADQFMDKIVQVTFNLPQVSLEDCEKYIEEISPHAKEAVLPHLAIITAAVKNNPRRLKRFLNNLSLQEGLFKNRGKAVTFAHLLYWSILDYAYPKLSALIKENPQILETLQENIKNIDAILADKMQWEIPQEALEKVPAGLQLYIQKKDLVAIVRQFDITLASLKDLFTSSAVVESGEEKKEKSEAAKAEAQSSFDKMVKVPKGPFLYGGDKKELVIDTSFEIGVYLVTNGQYRKFIDAGGYGNDAFWSDAGKKWREKNKITQPEYWEDERWNPADFPVVGVSYYEAEAFAKWTGKRLPTEQEWEKAARGEDGKVYPWGDEFDKSKCNSNESGIKGTSRVDRFPNGVSPYGCYDMAGNVCEWTNSYDDEIKARRVLRGGPWYGTPSLMRSAGRFRRGPDFRDYADGFRLARTLK